MAKRFLVPLNIVRLASNPATGIEGDVYFNTTSQELRVYSEGIWKSVGYDLSASVATIPYVDTQIDDIYDFIFDGLTTDDIQEGEYNFYFSPENIIDVAGSAINAASANALNEAIIYTDNELSDLNIFSTIVTEPATQTIVGDSNSDALTFIAGENISITAASASDSVTIGVSGIQEQIDDLLASIAPSSASATASRITAYVKNGSTALAKGTPVYITGSDGTNIIVGPASNSSEPTSSKTLGFTQTALNANQHGYIVLEGTLTGLNTNEANAGDPIWLGETPGTVIYGLANKPQAPNHLVYLGVVSRKNISNGEIFVKIQNGFELKELHDVRINGVANDDIIIYNSASSIWVNSNRFSTLETLVTEIEQNNNELVTTVVNTNSPTPVDSWTVGTLTTIEYLIQIKQNTNYYSAKIIAVTDGNIINYNKHGIITIGDPIPDLSITASISSGVGRLWVQISDGLTNNAEVKVLKTKIA